MHYGKFENGVLINYFEDTLGNTYVLRDDYLREVNRLNKRIERLEAYNKENELRLHSEVGSESREEYVKFLEKQKERGW